MMVRQNCSGTQKTHNFTSTSFLSIDGSKKLMCGETTAHILQNQLALCFIHQSQHYHNKYDQRIQLRYAWITISVEVNQRLSRRLFNGMYNVLTLLNEWMGNMKQTPNQRQMSCSTICFDLSTFKSETKEQQQRVSDLIV